MVSDAVTQSVYWHAILCCVFINRSSNQTFQRSDLFPSTMIEVKGKPMGTYFSYDTCGGEGSSWDTYQSLREFKGQEFTVAIPA